MTKFLTIVFLLFSSLFFIPQVYAQSANSFVSVVNPVRGGDFWDLPNQKPQDNVLNEEQVLKKYNLTPTWLIRYDALKDSNVLNALKNLSGSEYGILFEVTPSLTTDARVVYHQSSSWHSAASVFLSGYSLDDRKKLIDTAFEQFKKDFGFYPKSVGAWWIDSYSLTYIQQKYGVVASLEVADQYSTDDYQIWGQYFGTPYIPAKNDVLHPAQEASEKLPLVMMQWAARDPVNSYGNGVEESTYSVQANDYLDYHNLDANYFSALVDIYTKQPQNQFNQLTVGLENSYSWQKYGAEYEKQMAILSAKMKSGQFGMLTMSGFAQWYLNRFPNLSPTQSIVSTDPLGSGKKSVWFMNPYYRVGWFYNSNGSLIRDVRQYIAGEEELCLKVVCSSVNFATAATRVLDDVSFGQKIVLDPGKISNFDFKQNGENYFLTYTNQAGNNRSLEFLARDISIDGNISTIDGFILKAQTSPSTSVQYALRGDAQKSAPFKESIPLFLVQILKFILFVILGLLLPGLSILKKIKDEDRSLFETYFLSIVLGLVFLTVSAYLLSYLKLFWLSGVLAAVLDIWAIKTKAYKALLFNRANFKKIHWPVLLLIIFGVMLQLIPVVRSGVVYDYGMGFWGANGHDGLWHLSLASDLLQGLPAQNPILSGEVLKNYHFLYDLLLGITSYFSKIPLSDLLFRFYPTLFSISLGVGSYYLALKLFKSKAAAMISLYFIYFSGSFGWIAEILTRRGYNGESAFWANQMVSFNFNPPFAISLVILIAFLDLLILFSKNYSKKLLIILAVLGGSLVGFKSYAGVLVVGTLFLVGAIKYLKSKDVSFIKLFIFSALISLVFILPNFTIGASVFILSPFWLVHSMLDDPDRVGWARLSMARMAYSARGQWLKFLLVEIIGLTIFIVGNLGTKIFGGVYLFKSKLEEGAVKLFVGLLCLFSIVVPLLFIQAGNSWNIIQFFYYFMYFGALFSGPAVYLIFKRLPKVLGLVTVIFVLLLTPFNALVSANMYTGEKPHTFISPNELQALKVLASKPYGNVLTYPYDQNAKNNLSDPRPLFAYDSTAYVSAFSGKPTFVEDLVQQDILQTDYLKRIVEERDFFGGNDPVKKINFLKVNQIRYIYSLKYFNISIDEQKLNLKKIFDNSEVSIYETGN